MKGQYFSFDAIVASVIFVLAVVALLSYWHSVKSYLDYQSDDLSREAVRISNLLLTPAYPAGSCGDSIESLGLSGQWSERSRISSQALSCAEGEDSAWLKERLGTPYEVFVEVHEIGTGADERTIGTAPPADAATIVKLRRLATMVDEQAGTATVAAIDVSVYR